VIERTVTVTIRPVCNGCGARGAPAIANADTEALAQQEAVERLRVWRGRYGWIVLSHSTVPRTGDLCEGCARALARQEGG
jgi:hypothetical protein